MKVTSFFKKYFWLGLAVVVVAALTIFKLSPSFAYSHNPAVIATIQKTAATTTLAQYDSTASASLYRRLGGYNRVAQVIDDALVNVLNDPLISKYFIGLSTNSKQRLRQLLVDQFCQAAGGPCVYTGRTMKLAHSGIGGGLTNQEFIAFSQDVAKALDKNNVGVGAKLEVLNFVNSLRDQIVERP